MILELFGIKKKTKSGKFLGIKFFGNSAGDKILKSVSGFMLFSFILPALIIISGILISVVGISKAVDEALESIVNISSKITGIPLTSEQAEKVATGENEQTLQN